jgi:cyclic pyranopterin phosphate synthase
VSTYLTTNGTTLRIHADRMRKAGLVGVNISIDSLIPERFLQITQRDALHLVLDGIGAAVEAGLATKLNVVVMRHLNADELCDFVEFVRTRPVQVRFIEFMPFLGNQWSVDDVFSFQEMKEQIQSKYDLIPRTRLTSDVATEFTIDGFSGTVGFVTSVTESFCEGCNRLRLTADGRFKTCLFTPPQSGLRDMLRSGASDEDLAIAIRTDLSGKWKGHPSMKSWQQRDTLTMVQIGG